MGHHLDTDTNSGGIWFGIELNAEYSRNKFPSNGQIQKIKYFTSSRHCNALFVQKSNICLPPKYLIKKGHSPPPPQTPSPKISKSKRKKRKDKERSSSVFSILKNKITGNSPKNGDAKHIKSDHESINSPKNGGRKRSRSNQFDVDKKYKKNGQ